MVDRSNDSIEQHPVSDLQLKQLQVEWIPYDTVRPNAYNPNRMTPHDRALLRQSILEDGWTQPIVVLMDGTIIDGEQRWSVSGMPLTVKDIDAVIAKMKRQAEEGGILSDSIMYRLTESRRRLEAIEAAGKVGKLASLTSGLIPVTRVDFWDDAHKMISTIRHNRARGSHNLDAMANIMADLKQLGLDIDDLEVRLGMSDEEAHRLLDLADMPTLIAKQMEGQPVSRAWEMAHVTELTDAEMKDRDWERSQAVADAGAKDREMALLEREKIIAKQMAQVVAEKEAEVGRSLIQEEKQEIRKEIEEVVPAPLAPERIRVKKLTFLVTEAEYDLIISVLGEEAPVQGLLRLCRELAGKND